MNCTIVRRKAKNKELVCQNLCTQNKLLHTKTAAEAAHLLASLGKPTTKHGSRNKRYVGTTDFFMWKPEHLLTLIGAQSQGLLFKDCLFSLSSRPCKTLFIKTHCILGKCTKKILKTRDKLKGLAFLGFSNSIGTDCVRTHHPPVCLCKHSNTSIAFLICLGSWDNFTDPMMPAFFCEVSQTSVGLYA